MSKGTEGHFDTLPIGRLGLIPLNSSAALGKKVDDYLVSWRKGAAMNLRKNMSLPMKDMSVDSYIIQSQVPRFGSGEAKVSSTNLSAVTISTFCSMSATTA